MIDYISLIIVAFIAICALLWMHANKDKYLIAGEPIQKGRLVCMSGDRLYEASPVTTGIIGICMDNPDERTLEDVIQIG